MKVWTVIFDEVDFADLNGVFSTKEKAIKAVFAHAERCSDVWSNVRIVEDDEDWVLISFDYDDGEYQSIEEDVCLTCHTLDEI